MKGFIQRRRQRKVEQQQWVITQTMIARMTAVNDAYNRLIHGACGDEVRQKLIRMRDRDILNIAAEYDKMEDIE